MSPARSLSGVLLNWEYRNVQKKNVIKESVIYTLTVGVDVKMRFITRTLFPGPDRTYFILVSLAKPYHSDTVLLIVYVVLKLVYPNCTHTVF